MQIDSNAPDAYISGGISFFGLQFKVTPNVLIPRPETEMLVVEALEKIKQYDLETIIDVGTGSGCIAIAIAKKSPTVYISAVDISPATLGVAKENAKTHGVGNEAPSTNGRGIFSPLSWEQNPSEAKGSYPPPAGLHPKSVARGDQIEFIQSDLLEKIDISPDLIVTNLPYIPSSRIPQLEPSVRNFEPHLALDGGSDGFELYRKLFSQIVTKKISPKFLIAEIDDTHGTVALIEVKKFFPTASVEIKKDFANLDRILIISF